MIKYLLFIIMQIPFLAHAQMIEELSATPHSYDKLLINMIMTSNMLCKVQDL